MTYVFLGIQPPGDRRADPGDVRTMLGEQAHLAAASELDGHGDTAEVHLRRVVGWLAAIGGRPTATPPVGDGARPRVGIATPQVRARCRPIHDERPERLQAPAIAAVEQGIRVGYRHDAIIAGPDEERPAGVPGLVRRDPAGGIGHVLAAVRSSVPVPRCTTNRPGAS